MLKNINSKKQAQKKQENTKHIMQNSLAEKREKQTNTQTHKLQKKNLREKTRKSTSNAIVYTTRYKHMK